METLFFSKFLGNLRYCYKAATWRNKVYASVALLLASLCLANNVSALSCSATADTWGTGYVLNVTVTNNSSAAISAWQINLNFSQSPGVTGSWNATTSTSGNVVSAANISWNGNLAAGQSTSFGLQGMYSGSFVLPTCFAAGSSSSSSSVVLSSSSSSSVISSSSSSLSSSVISSSSSSSVISSSSSSSSGSVELVIQENAAGFCSIDGTIDSNNSGFTGSGFANTDNASGKRIIWSVTVPASGNYLLEWRYANGSSTARSGLVKINGASGVNVNLPGTGSWTEWTVDAANVSLSAGKNEIILESTTAEGLANIDSLTVIGSYVQPASCVVNSSSSSSSSSSVGSGSTGLVGFATLNGGTTGGKSGQTVTVTDYASLKSYAESSTPYTIMVQGTISNGSGGGSISVGSNKSIIGVGSSAFLSGVGLSVKSNNNVIVQNLKMSLIGAPSANGGDIVTISGTSKNIWIDHCELFSEDPDVQTNIDKYDGLIDIRDQTGFITLSWNYLHDHHKGGLVGASDTDLYSERKITMHHNYYRKVKLRIPMYRGSTGHFFNNYIVGAQDATEIRAGTCVRVEKNYYEELHYSIYTPSDSKGKTERIDNIEVKRTARAYPESCTADIPYSYASALTNNTNDVKTLVPQSAGVGKL